MPKTLVILNDPPYGTERSYNGLRVAGALAQREGEEVKVFLIGDASGCAKKAQSASAPRAWTREASPTRS